MNFDISIATEDEFAPQMDTHELARRVQDAVNRYLSDLWSAKHSEVRVSVRPSGGKTTKQRFAEGGVVSNHIGRKHPFEGPEVFDDDITVATFEQRVNAPQEVVSSREDYERAMSRFPNWPQGGSAATVPITEELAEDLTRSLSEDFPHLSTLLNVKREEQEVKRAKDAEQPPAEGDWTLESGDNVGAD